MWQVGTSAGRQVGRSAGWQVGRSVGRQVGTSAGRQVGRSVGRSAGWQVGRPPGRQVGRSAGRQVGESVVRQARWAARLSQAEDRDKSEPESLREFQEKIGRRFVRPCARVRRSGRGGRGWGEYFEENVASSFRAFLFGGPARNAGRVAACVDASRAGGEGVAVGAVAARCGCPATARWAPPWAPRFQRTSEPEFGSRQISRADYLSESSGQLWECPFVRMFRAALAEQSVSEKLGRGNSARPSFRFRVSLKSCLWRSLLDLMSVLGSAATTGGLYRGVFLWCSTSQLFERRVIDKSFSPAPAWPRVRRGTISTRARRWRRETDDSACVARLLGGAPCDLKNRSRFLSWSHFAPILAAL